MAIVSLVFDIYIYDYMQYVRMSSYIHILLIYNVHELINFDGLMSQYIHASIYLSGNESKLINMQYI